jgi:hypothetical protein
MTRVADEGAAVPGIWHLEVGNILLMTERRQRISAAARVAELEDLARLPITRDTQTASAHGAIQPRLRTGIASRFTMPLIWN